ncbi:hypothetical protein [Agrococcus sp. DT81.2]|uniref:phage tail tube protein n=1 Tax=Agrococcus sp. DT81.2 TaxID=3393414 RepID=UPI003CE57450
MARTVNIPRNVDVDENLAIVVIPKADLPDPSAPSAAALNGATDVTYEHTTDGLNATSSQATVTDPRLSLRDVPEAPGTISHSLEVTYFYGDDELVLDTLLVEGDEVFYVIRDSVRVEEDFAADQKVDVYSAVVGEPRKNRATGGKQTKTTTLFVQRKYTDVLVAA